MTLKPYTAIDQTGPDGNTTSGISAAELAELDQQNDGPTWAARGKKIKPISRPVEDPAYRGWEIGG